MNIEISGAVLSSLFFEHSVCNNDLEGFLLGRITNRRTDTISDAQISGVKEETTCYIYSYVSCPRPFSWYANSGATDADKLKNVLSANKITEVVGWYKFRRNSTLITSLRERAIHRHLLQCFPGIVMHNFIFLLCTLQQSPNKSTHTMDHVFQIYNGSCFQGLPVSVINLGDNVIQYKIQGTLSVTCNGGRFAEIINRQCGEFLSEHGELRSVVTMSNMSRALNDQLQNLCLSVWESEDDLQKLRQDIRQLRSQLNPPPHQQKSELVKRDLNPFKTTSTSDASFQQTTRVFSPKNPFYSGYQTIANASLYDPPPPYSEFDDLFGNNPSNLTSVSAAVDTLPPDIDLIALNDSNDDLPSGPSLIHYYNNRDSNMACLLDEPTTLLDTSVPSLGSETSAGWNIPGSEAKLEAFTFLEDFGSSASSARQTSGFSQTAKDGDVSEWTVLKQTNDLSVDGVYEESHVKKVEILEAIEQSSDEDQHET